MERLVGKKAPNFEMTAVSGDGERFFQVKLSDYEGKWLILFFYPLDFTFVCPTEITGFSKDYEKFSQAGAEILAVSADSHYSHQAWIRDGLGKIAYPIGADKTLRITSDYGLLLEDEGVALRGLFIIDPRQVVRYSVIHDLNVGRSMEETMRVLKALQTGGLCGASWAQGDANLPEGEKQAEEAKGEAAAREKPAAGKEGNGPELRIYTMPDCSYCKKVKEFLGEHGVAYTEVNLQTDKKGQDFMAQRGYTALPVMVIGEVEISGYNMNRIRETLRQAEKL